MRPILAILPLLASVAACVDIPQASRQQNVRTSSSATFSSPTPGTRQCLAQLGATRANFTPLPDRYFDSGRSTLGSRLVKIETFGSYACRNVAGTSRRSGHASANAIDVSAFVLADGRKISVLQG
jgi:hypothetical protein